MFIESREKIGELLKSLNLTGNGIEIGVAKGQYSNIILSNFQLSKVYLLDLWKNLPREEYDDLSNKCQSMMDARYEMVVANTKKFGDKVEILRKSSREAYKDFADEFFDFIYVDANHSYEGVMIDLVNWYPKCKVGGVFSGHDYLNIIKPTASGSFGVKKAVDEFAVKVQKNVIVIPDRGTLPQTWYWIK